MKISYIIDRIIMKLDRAEFSRHILVPIKSSIFSVKAMLFVIMLGIDIFSAYWKKISTIDDNPTIEFSNFNTPM
uniref:Uncharacterized protein n=1 Tax=Acrobeloides nanus TaxID=290746 RepID=A0A914EIR9_9BILA